MSATRDQKLARLRRLEDRGVVLQGPHRGNVWAVSDELLVRARDIDAVEHDLRDAAAGRRGEVRVPWQDDPDDEDPVVDVLKLARGRDPFELTRELRTKGRSVSPNHLVTALQRRLGFPDTDPERLDVADLPGLPAPLPAQGAGVRVAVIDTGFSLDGRGWLAGNVATAASDDERDIVGADGHIDRLDEAGDGFLDVAAGHGAFIAGLVRRLAPQAEIHFIKALDASGIGTELGVARAIRWAVRRKPHVINLSLGFYTTGDTTPPLVAAAVRHAQSRPEQPAIVAAVGNDGIADPTWPSSCEGVIGVGALNPRTGKRARFSNKANVDVLAPGVMVSSCYVSGTENAALTYDGNADTFDGAARWSGTSFAAGIVSGTIAAAVTPGQPADVIGQEVIDRARGVITPDWAFD